MKRQRGRGRKPGGGGHQGNRPLESNGPDVKIRGTAPQIYEKYMQYARDAQSGGDRVRYENFLQHAEHYFRVMAATMPRDRIFPQQGEGGVPMQQQGEGGERPPMGEGVGPGPGGEMTDPLRVMDEGALGDDDGDYDDGDDGDEGGDQDRGEVQAQGQEGGNGNQQGERHGRRRRRGRRRHHDNYGQGGGGNNSGGNGNNNGNDNEARSALDSLARRQGALAGD